MALRGRTGAAKLEGKARGAPRLGSLVRVALRVPRRLRRTQHERRDASASAQTYEQVLPSQLTRLTISQQLIDIGHSPTLRPGNATIEGATALGVSEVRLSLFRTASPASPTSSESSPELVEEFELPVEPDSGSFQAQIAATVTPGSYALYVNNALAGVFSVQPIGVDAGGSSGGSLSLPWTQVLVALGLVLAIGLGAGSLVLQLQNRR